MARENTRRSYRAVVKHFEVTWGGFLPATGDGIVRYLAEYADQHSISNAWLHWCSGTSPKDFLIPPKAQRTADDQGHSRAASRPGKAGRPLLLQHLEHAVAGLEREAEQAATREDLASVLRSRRDIDLVLIDVWSGFRGDALSRLPVEHTQAQAGGRHHLLPAAQQRRPAAPRHYVPYASATEAVSGAGA